MGSASGRDRLERLKDKHADGLLLWELQNGFEFSPREAVLVFESAKSILSDRRDVEWGRHRVVGVEMGESAGKSIRQAKKKQVLVTLDGGLEDLEYEGKHGRMELRRMRLLRVIEEGIDQGVVFSEEDLGKFFGISVRTVRRDVQALRRAGCEVQSRGYYEGIGRAISHKARIVEYYLQGMSYGQIEDRSRHTVQAIKRYVETFSRVAYAIRRRGLRAKERCYVLGISRALLREYERLYWQARKLYGGRLQEIERRYGGYSNPLPYKEIDRRKEGFGGGMGKKRRNSTHASA